MSRPSKVKAPSFAGPKPSSAAASKVKARNRSRDSGPEVMPRRSLSKLGVRYRLHATGLPAKPDLVLASARLAVFVDGDFWQGRDWSKRKAVLQRGHNAEYWTAKIAANRQRDRRQSAALRKLGWRVIRVWESDVRRNPDSVAARITRA